MDILNLQKKKVSDLREIALAMGFTELSKYKKDALIDLIVNGNLESKSIEEDPFVSEIEVHLDNDDVEEVEEADETEEVTLMETGMVYEEVQKKPARFQQGTQDVEGVLEIIEQGYGFLRFENFLSSEQDVYVSPSQIRKFSMRTGDKILGATREPNAGERFRALLYVKSINGLKPESNYKRPKFDDLTPMYPQERFRLSGNRSDHAMRIIGIVSPIGKGQRGLIVAPPKSGKTILLQKIAKAISENYPEVELI
ncbi:MAG TPA: transcription termination factor Rho, partial [Clostridiales bacterium UBA8960]|nr:transcription termination factor Rho [Clostridiales bacterium UBA8960]